MLFVKAAKLSSARASCLIEKWFESKALAEWRQGVPEEQKKTAAARCRGGFRASKEGHRGGKGCCRRLQRSIFISVPFLTTSVILSGLRRASGGLALGFSASRKQIAGQSPCLAGRRPDACWPLSLMESAGKKL